MSSQMFIRYVAILRSQAEPCSAAKQSDTDLIAKLNV